MVDWHSPSMLQANGNMIVHLAHLLAGIFLWDFFRTLPFDFDFITRKKTFRWPLIFYFANRYLMLTFYIVLLYFYNIPTDHEIDCRTVYALLHAFGEIARGLASINLAIRTIAVWGQNRVIIGFLCLMVLGHWSLIIVDVHSSNSVWSEGFGCLVLDHDFFWLTAVFVYAMCFDLGILLLTGYKLAVTAEGVNWSLQHRLTNLIFNQGLSFYLASLLFDLLTIIFLSLNLNVAMATLFCIPTGLVSTLVACNAVRNLTNMGYESQDKTSAHIYSGPSGTHKISRSRQFSFRNTSSKGGVIIEMQSSLQHAPDSKMVTLSSTSV